MREHDLMQKSMQKLVPRTWTAIAVKDQSLPEPKWEDLEDAPLTSFEARRLSKNDRIFLMTRHEADRLVLVARPRD
jgi:hypothetical protein